jgi:hypothetical protein
VYCILVYSLLRHGVVEPARQSMKPDGKVDAQKKFGLLIYEEIMQGHDPYTRTD